MAEELGFPTERAKRLRRQAAEAEALAKAAGPGTGEETVLLNLAARLRSEADQLSPPV